MDKESKQSIIKRLADPKDPLHNKILVVVDPEGNQTHTEGVAAEFLEKNAISRTIDSSFHFVATNLFKKASSILGDIGGDIRAITKTNRLNEILSKQAAEREERQRSEQVQQCIEPLEARRQAILEVAGNKDLTPLELVKKVQSLNIVIPNGVLEQGKSRDEKAEDLRKFLNDEAEMLQQQLTEIKDAPIKQKAHEQLLRELFVIAHDSTQATGVALLIKPEVLQGLINEFVQTHPDQQVDLQEVHTQYKKGFETFGTIFSTRNSTLDEFLKLETNIHDRRQSNKNALSNYVAYIYALSPQEAYEEIKNLIDQFSIEPAKSGGRVKSFGELATDAIIMFLRDGTSKDGSGKAGESEKLTDCMDANILARYSLAMGRACHYESYHSEAGYNQAESLDASRLSQFPLFTRATAAGANLIGVSVEIDKLIERIKGFDPQEGEEDMAEGIKEFIDCCKRAKMPQRNSPKNPPSGQSL